MRAAAEEQPARVGDLGDAVAGHLEAADLVGRAEAVLERADEAQRGLAVALELADDVDEVLEQARAGDRAVFGDVADEQHGQVAVFGDADEGARDLAHLAAGRRRGPRRSSCDTVCTESTITRCGSTASIWPRIVARSVSAARKSSSCRAPVRSARIRTWLTDSSALT